eukprot:SAG22_NODE_7559_length_728_cov_3.513514_1_plen_25_part_10
MCPRRRRERRRERKEYQCDETNDNY